MTAAQPNNLGYLAGTVGDEDVTDVVHRDVESPSPKYTGDMPDDPEEARSYRPGEDQPDEERADEERPDEDDG